MTSRKSLVLLVLLTACLLPATAADVPVWLSDAASLMLPDHSPETEAVVLLDEQGTKVNPDGTINTSRRRAVKVLRKGGIDEARLLVLANAYDTKIRSMTGWNVTEGRKTLKVTMKDAIETGLAPDTLYSDVSMRILAVPSVAVGSIVGFEWEEERKPPSLEDIFQFQGRFPVGRARYSINLPSGWTVDAHWANWAPQPGQPGTGPAPSMVWDVTNIPAIEKEPLMPKSRTLAGRLVVRLKARLPDRRSFSGWADIGAWYEALSKECRLPAESTSNKVHELTAGAPDTLSKLRGLAEFAQKEIRYVAIEIGIGGYKPHTATSILANRYGDCKDKATLLASLLQASGVDSYYLIVNTERGDVTLESPPSLASFNHVILAVRLPDDVPDNGLPAVIRHPKFGRLLVFDPTYAYAPLGHMPIYLQGNTALLVADGGGELISLPFPSPEANLLDRRGRFNLSADGTLEGEIQETRRGTMADATRYVLLNSTNAERTKFMETFLANFFAGFVLQASEIKNLDENSLDLILTYRFKVPNYAKAAGGMMIVRPRVVGDKREKLETNDNTPRRYPIDFDSTSEQRDEFTIELAEGCRVEGLPPASDIDAGFAVYRARTEESGRAVVYRRKYRLLQPMLPASRYEEAVRFFRAMDADQRQSVLLNK
jgi:hypothetical protein